MPKSAVEPMNNIKNKLNSKIVLIFNPNPNAHSMEGQDETAIHNFKLMTSSNIAKLWCLLEFSPPTWYTQDLFVTIFYTTIFSV